MGGPLKGGLYGYLELLLLASVRSQPSHGFAIIQELKRKSRGEFDLQTGAIYPELHRLVEAGLLSSRREGQRIIYRITPKGLRKLEAQTEKWRKFSGALGAVLET